MTVNVVRADPAGNITLLVTSSVPRVQYAKLSARLMENSLWKAEQVGFIVPPIMGGDGRLEMMGGEFCGNALRSAGFYMAKQKGIKKPRTLMMECSGASALVPVSVDPEQGTASCLMPLPKAFIPMPECGPGACLVEMEGIAHLILPDRSPDEAFICKGLRRIIERLPGLDACGLMFLRPNEKRMHPVVFVRATDTLVHESSCASGSAAAAACLAMQSEETNVQFSLRQPGGTIEAEVATEKGRIVSLSIGGTVHLDEPNTYDTGGSLF